MKNRKGSQNRKSRFDLETERRRREMLAAIGQASTKVSHSWLRMFARRVRKSLLSAGGVQCKL